jgi:hypothetical protein
MSDPLPEASGASPADGSRLHTIAFALAASVIGVPAVIALLVQAVLFQLNPRALDLADPASYEVEFWVALIVPAVIMLILIARTFSQLAAAAGRRSLRYPTLVIQLQVGFAIAAIALVLLTPRLVL